MKVTFVKPEKIDVAESDIQKEFEKNLEHLDDSGLKYVASYVPIGTGIIDTLAVDDDLNPVIIEYNLSTSYSVGPAVQAFWHIWLQTHTAIGTDSTAPQMKYNLEAVKAE